MSEKGPRADVTPTRPYEITQTVYDMLRERQTRNWRRAQRHLSAPRRYWLRNQRAFCRNLIRSDLVAHRRMFGVSHKHVQPGQTSAQQD